jgi:hypothetical protein
MAQAYGCVRSDWSVAVSAGRAGRSRRAACVRKSCKFFCTDWTPRRDRIGSAGNFPPLWFFPLHFSLDSNFPFCHTCLVLGIEETAVVQGRVVTGADLERIRELIRAHPGWSRRRLSEVLAWEWDWRNAAGRVKDMAARSLLVKLDQRGWIQLPPRRWAATNRMQARVIGRRLWDTTPLQGTLAELGPLEIREVSGEAEGRETLAACWR